VMMAAGLRATAKAVEHPPEPKIGAPVLDPTAIVAFGSRPCENAQLILRRYDSFDFEAEKSKTSNLHAWKSHVVSGDFRSADVFTRPRSGSDLWPGTRGRTSQCGQAVPVCCARGAAA